MSEEEPVYSTSKSALEEAAIARRAVKQLEQCPGWHWHAKKLKQEQDELIERLFQADPLPADIPSIVNTIVRVRALRDAINHPQRTYREAAKMGAFSAATLNAEKI